METVTLLTYISIYIVLVTILFNLLRFAVKLNLPSSLVLSTNISFLMSRICINEAFMAWGSEYLVAIIILEALIAIFVVIARPDKKCNSTDNTKNQRKTWIVTFRTRKGN